MNLRSHYEPATISYITAALVPMLLVNPWRTLQAWARPKVQLRRTRDIGLGLAAGLRNHGGNIRDYRRGIRTLISDPSARSIRIKDLVPGTGIYRGLTVIAKTGTGTPATRPLPRFT